jgi:hypothetical protein
VQNWENIAEKPERSVVLRRIGIANVEFRVTNRGADLRRRAEAGLPVSKLHHSNIPNLIIKELYLFKHGFEVVQPSHWIQILRFP